MDRTAAISEPNFQRLFESSPCPYLILSPTFKIAAVSDAYLKATLTEREDILGRDLFDVFPDNPTDPDADGVQNLRSSLEFVLHNRCAHYMALQKYDIRRPNSEEFEVHFWSPSNHPVVDEQGSITHIIHHVEDVTEVVRLGNAEIDLDRFFTLSLDMLCIANADGYFKHLSPAFTTTLGWSVEELLARPFLDFVHPDDRASTLQEVERQVMKGQVVLQFENRYRHKDGSWRTLSWNSLPQPDGFLYATARDVTNQKEAEFQIAELNRGLELRAAELEAAKKEAERANRAKSEFLSRMSHELRTPMNAVIGYAQLLQMESNDPKTLESAQAILKGSRHLLGLINEVLDLARIEAGRLAVSLEPVSVIGAIQHAVDLVQPTAEARGVRIILELESDAEDHVLADRQRLIQVLVNLITNAVKYNRVDGRVRIRGSTTASVSYKIVVEDTGCGIAAEDIQRLFQPFERLGDQSEEGTGLGLALSRNLMLLMGGSISLSRTGFEGSTFCIELQRALVPSVEMNAVNIHGALNLNSLDERLRIVYIEDNVSNIRLLESVFKNFERVEMMTAMQASVGIRLVEDHRPDVVLLDLHLPDGEGINVLKYLRSNEMTSTIPVIVISADATETQIKRLMSAGAKAYLTKPIELTDLLVELSEIKPLQGKVA